MRYRLSTLMIWMAIAPPVLALAWFILPVIFVPMIGCGLVAAALMFSGQWAERTNEATRAGADDLLRKIAELNDLKR